MLLKPRMYIRGYVWIFQFPADFLRYPAMTVSLDNLRSPAALARFALVASAGLALDLWIKWLAFAKLADGIFTSPEGRVRVYARRSIELIPRFIHIDVTANQGAVFGLGQGQRWGFVCISVLAIIFLGYLFVTSGKRWLYQIVLGMLLAGVLGNMYDRVTLGYVRDMIHALPGWNWPQWIKTLLPGAYGHMEIFPWVFNIADSLLCIGVGIMVLMSFFSRSNDPSQATAAPPQARKADHV